MHRTPWRRTGTAGDQRPPEGDHQEPGPGMASSTTPPTIRRLRRRSSPRRDRGAGLLPAADICSKRSPGVALSNSFQFCFPFFSMERTSTALVQRTDRPRRQRLSPSRSAHSSSSGRRLDSWPMILQWQCSHLGASAVMAHSKLSNTWAAPARMISKSCRNRFRRRHRPHEASRASVKQFAGQHAEGPGPRFLSYGVFASCGRTPLPGAG